MSLIAGIKFWIFLTTEMASKNGLRYGFGFVSIYLVNQMSCVASFLTPSVALQANSKHPITQTTLASLMAYNIKNVAKTRIAMGKEVVALNKIYLIQGFYYSNSYVNCCHVFMILKDSLNSSESIFQTNMLAYNRSATLQFLTLIG